VPRRYFKTTYAGGKRTREEFFPKTADAEADKPAPAKKPTPTPTRSESKDSDRID
jgi:hypothetical protein